MSTHNICFYEEMMKIIFQLSTNMHLICSSCTVMGLSFQTDRSGQTVQTQIRRLIEQSDQGLHCLMAVTRVCFYCNDAKFFRQAVLGKQCSSRSGCSLSIDKSSLIRASTV